MVLVISGSVSGSNVRDVWSSSNEGSTWVQTTSSPAFTGRRGAVAVVLSDDTIVLIGGNDGSDKNDVRVFQPVTARVEWH